MKAVIETGGKQYLVEKGSVIYVEKMDAEPGKKVNFNVLMVDGTVGHPYVTDAEVTGEVVKHGKQKKVVVYKYNAKKKYRRRQGHRQPYTKIEIKSVTTK